MADPMNDPKHQLHTEERFARRFLSLSKLQRFQLAALATNYQTTFSENDAARQEIIALAAAILCPVPEDVSGKRR